MAYSADVQIRLNVNGLSVHVAQLGPDFIILQEGVNHPRGEAEMVLRVDASESRCKVFLPVGLSENAGRIPIVAKP